MKKLCMVSVISLIAANASAVINVDLGTGQGTFSGQGVYADPGNNIWNDFNSFFLKYAAESKHDE